MYTDIWELIGFYSALPVQSVEADPVYARIVDDHNRIFIRDNFHGLEGYCHMMVNRKGKYDFLLYVPICKMQQISTTFLHPPLQRSYDCYYTRYKLYLNLVAYLSKKPVGQLQVVEVGLEPKIHTMEYREKVCEMILKDFEMNHQVLPEEAITASSLNSLAKGKKRKQ